MSETESEVDDSIEGTERLAQRLGLRTAVFVDLFGSGWHQDFYGHDGPDGPWWVTGEPIQLMLSPQLDGDAALVSVPQSLWRDWKPVYVPGRTELVRVWDQAEIVRSIVTSLLRARRASFRYCRYCRSLTPPEYRHEPDVCRGCSERWLDVVH